MLRRIRAPHDVPHPGPRPSVTARDPRGPEARLEQPDAAGARVARRAVADPAPHADRGADPVRDARARAVGRRDRPHLRLRRPGLRARVGVRAAAVRAARRRARHRARPRADGARLAGVRARLRAGVVRDARAGLRDADVRLRRGALRHQLPGAAAGDHARPAARADDGDDALPDRRRGAARVARRRRARDGDRPAGDAADDRRARARCSSPARCSGRRCGGIARCRRWRATEPAVARQPTQAQRCRRATPARG